MLLRWLLAAMTLAAGLISGYLAWHVWQQGPIAGCGVGSGCGIVLNSHWSSVWGIPVSAGACLMYLGMAVALVLLRPTASPRLQRGLWMALFTGALLAVGGSIWFTMLQWRSVGSFCQYCMVTHTLGLTAGVLLILLTPVTRTAKTSTTIPGAASLSPRHALLAVGVALCLMGGLIGAQLLQRPAPPRSVALLQGQLAVDVSELPKLGNPQAPLVVISLFDYACPHCRVMHEQLAEAQQVMGDDLLIVPLPVPLDAACNPNIVETEPRFIGSCERARLALAVWRARPAAFAGFDAWMFQSPQPRSVEDARAEAVHRVGEPALAAALADPWIDQVIQQSLSLHEKTAGPDGWYIAVPKLITPRHIITQTHPSATSLIQALRADLPTSQPAGEK